MIVRNRIAITPIAGVTPLAYQAVQASACHAQLYSLLESRLGQEHACFLAEPQTSGSGTEIDWYAGISGQAIRLVDLPEAERQPLLERIARMAADITQLAQTLRAGGDSNSLMAAALLELALSYPSLESLYLVGSQPVLILWGYAPAGLTASPEPLTRLAAMSAVPRMPQGNAQPEVVEEKPAPIAEKAVTPPVAEPVERRTFSWAWLIPFLLGLLICGILLWLLKSGLLPTGLLPSGCSRQVAPLVLEPSALTTPELSVSLEQTTRLQEELARLQTDYAARVQQCPPQRSQVEPPRQSDEPAQPEELVIPPKITPPVERVPLVIPQVQVDDPVEPVKVPEEVVPPVVPVPEVVTPPVETVPDGPLADLDAIPLPEPKPEPVPEAVPQKKPEVAPQEEKPNQTPRKKQGDKLEIPKDAKKTKDLSFLEGCWLADTGKGIVNSVTGLPNAIKYCFDKKGRGTSYVQEHDAKHRLTSECKGPAQAFMSDDGVLLIDDNGSVTCPNGTRYRAERVHCKDQGGVAICSETLRRKWTSVPFLRTTR